MKIDFVTIGRFHVLDLARELSRLGHDVRFFSCVPSRRLGLFGLSRACARNLLPAAAPWLVLRRFAPFKSVRTRATRCLLEAVDRAAAGKLEWCDVLIGMSGICLESGRKARSSFGALFLLERGSRHILSQKEILDDLNARGSRGASVCDFEVERELAGYEAADGVVVPSMHAEQSFVERGFPPEKLLKIPYGVDISAFRPTPAPPPAPKTILFVGEWSRRKGADLLVAAVRGLEKVRLLHVGPLGDIPFPDDPVFVHHHSVEQHQLPSFYAQAHVSVLASREDGFGMVLAQALACGVPVVATDRTGGPDLKELISDPSWVTVVPAGQTEGLRKGLSEALQRGVADPLRRDGLGPARNSLSWEAYGKRYEVMISRMLARRAEKKDR